MLLAGDVNFLAFDEVVGENRRADFRKVAADAEFFEFRFRGNARFGELAAQRFHGALGFLVTGAKNDGLVAVGADNFSALLGFHGALFFSAHADDLAAFERQHGHGNVAAVCVEHAGHADLAGENAGTGSRQSH